jgi:hypothetical protein
MNIPQKLKNILNDALKAVENHSQHDLNWGYREAILVEMGPEDEYMSEAVTEGHKRRAVLAIMTARHVLSLWNKEFRNNKAELILAEAEQVLNRAIDLNKSLKNSLEYWDEIHYLAADSDITVCAGLSAVRVLDVALDDENFDPENIDYSKTDNRDLTDN